MRIDLSVVAIAALLGGCSRAEVLVRSYARVREVCPDAVVFYTSADLVSEQYREVALLPLPRVLGREDARRAGATIRRHAGQLGANAIIVTSAPEARASAKMLGPAIGDPAMRRGMAVAIDIPADSVRIGEVCDSPRTSTSTIVSRPLPLRSSNATTHLPLASREARQSPGERVAAVRLASTSERPFDLSGPDPLAASPPPTGSSDASAFMGNQDVRSALTNLQRLKIVTGAEEVGPGLVRLSIGTMAPQAQMEFHIGYLQGSYHAALPYGQDAVIELWRNGSKVGEYTRRGLELTGTP